jgi:hypothetical protein
MSEFFLDSETHRVEFPDGQWVDVKAELTQADQDYIMGQMAQAAGNEIQLRLGQLPLLERSIVAWSFPEPVTKENISRLRLRYRTVLLAEIDRLNTAAMEFARKK